MVAVSFIDADRQWFKSRIGIDDEETKRRDAFCAHTIAQPDVLVVSDATRDERFAANPMVTDDPHIRFYAGHPVRAPSGEAVGALCIIDVAPRELTAEERAALSDLAGLVDHELARTEELARAERVQRGLLPQRPPVIAGYDVAGACVPAAEVGGDFFDWYLVEGDLHVTIADVMGKGIGSAILAATVRAVLRSSSRAGGVAEMVTAASQGLQADLEETGSFVTLFTARLQTQQGRLAYVDAGHALTLLLDADAEPRLLPTDGLPIGVAEDDGWTEHHVSIGPGETLISVSDGLLDFFAHRSDVFDAARTVVRATSTAQEVVDEIVRFAAARRPTDDVTALVVRRDR
jgi:serine phosphatase RsbU (regulator of sigma subunit)